MSSGKRQLATLAVPLLALLWGLNWAAVRTILSWWSPWTLRTVGLGLAAVLLFLLARHRGNPLLIRRDHLPRLVVSSLLTIVGFNLATAFAQLAGSTSRAAIVTFTMPVWAVLFAWWVLDERLDRRRVVALLIGIAGLMLLIWPLFDQGLPLNGPLFGLLAGISWAAGTVFVKCFPIDAAPLPATAWQLLIGASCCAISGVAAGAFSAGPPVTAWTGAPAFAPATPFWFAAALIFHVVLANALAYVIWFDVVTRLPAGVAAMGTLMVPIVGVASAMLIFDERRSLADLVGFALILLAASLAPLPAAKGRSR